jgi:hypothetical protein
MRLLTLDVTDSTDDIWIAEFSASTRAERHAEVMREVAEVLGWARRHFPAAEGPLDEGGEWDHALQVSEEDGGWHAVTLTLSATPPLMADLLAQFAPGDD